MEKDNQKTSSLEDNNSSIIGSEENKAESSIQNENLNEQIKQTVFAENSFEVEGINCAKAVDDFDGAEKRITDDSLTKNTSFESEKINKVENLNEISAEAIEQEILNQSCKNEEVLNDIALPNESLQSEKEKTLTKKESKKTEKENIVKYSEIKETLQGSDDRTTSEQIAKMYEAIEYSNSDDGKAALKKSYTITLILNVAFVVILAFILLALAFVQTAKEKGLTPNIFGLYMCYVETGSMEPTIQTGSTILCCKPKDSSKLNKGDVVTFYNLEGDRITHRIVHVYNDDDGNVLYRTKGDNPLNSIDAETLTPDRVIAVMVCKLF